MGSQHEVTLFLVWILVCLPHITLRLRIFPPTLLTSSCLYLSPQIFSFSRLIGRDSDAGKDQQFTLPPSAAACYSATTLTLNNNVLYISKPVSSCLFPLQVASKPLMHSRST